MELIIGVSVLLNVALGWATFNLMRAVENYEDYFNQLNSQLVTVLRQIRSVDIRGSFEADDEVGLAFTAIKQMIYTLNAFELVTNDNQDNETA